MTHWWATNHYSKAIAASGTELAVRKAIISSSLVLLSKQTCNLSSFLQTLHFGQFSVFLFGQKWSAVSENSVILCSAATATVFSLIPTYGQEGETYGLSPMSCRHSSFLYGFFFLKLPKSSMSAADWPYLHCRTCIQWRPFSRMMYKYRKTRMLLICRETLTLCRVSPWRWSRTRGVLEFFFQPISVGWSLTSSCSNALGYKKKQLNIMASLITLRPLTSLSLWKMGINFP